MRKTIPPKTITSTQLAVGATAATYETALPANPVDGQQIYYAADATNGVIWHLRYRSSSSSSYKWEFVGGADAVARVSTSETTTSGTYADLATVGPSITLALAGDYQITAGSKISSNVSQWTNAEIGVADDGTVVGPYLTMLGNFYDAGATRRTGIGHFMTTQINTGVGAGSVIKLMYSSSNGSDTVTFAHRVLSIRPVRVG